MKTAAKLAISICCTFIYLNAIALPAYKLPNQDDPSTLLGPSLKGSYTSPLTENTAYSLLGELGFKNIRIGGTLGLRLAINQRLKFSAEYLWQEITYSYFSGNSDQWVNQGAIGVGYQYDFLGYRFDPSFDVDAYLSHAPSKSLNTITGNYVNKRGNSRSFINQRRVAGSNAAGIAPGISFSPWIGGRAGFDFNYDYVAYDNKFVSDQDAKGLGATAHLTHFFTDYFFIDLSAAVRQPFNYYTAKVGWINIPYYGGAWTLGFDGAYAVGKEGLPNTWNIGLTFDYLLQQCPVHIPLNLKGDYKGEAVPMPINDHFLPWTAKPAVYMPQVLAIVDENVTTRPNCVDGISPLNIATIPTQNIAGTVDIPTAQAFIGTNLVFSIISNATLPNAAVINPVTGVVTATALEDSFQVTVIARNACGSASTTFTVNANIG